MSRYDFNEIKKVFIAPKIYYFFLIFISYVIINYFMSGFNKTLSVVILYISTVNIFKLILSAVLSLLIGFLISINAVLLFIKYKERKDCKSSVGLTSMGTIGGLATGVCPLCITGLFPLIFSLFGVTFSYATLPFQGIEIQVFIVIILIISLLLLIKKTIKRNINRKNNT